jgi:metal-sulfur cluster biosynthetic enzyme
VTTLKPSDGRFTGSSVLGRFVPIALSQRERERIRADVLAALQHVVDPELDEALTDLGFIERIDVAEQGDVTIHMRLPTFWCSPSFAFLMAHDAREAALEVSGVRSVRLELCDHGQSDESSDGVSNARPFDEVFPDETDGDLEELRAVFNVKAFGMRQEQLVRALLGDGATPEEVVALRMQDVCVNQPGLRRVASLVRMYVDRRARLHLTSQALITDERGAAIAPDELESHLQRMRRQRVSMAFNASMCRGLLKTRYPQEDSTR